jgi:hypothetical protein
MVSKEFFKLLLQYIVVLSILFEFIRKNWKICPYFDTTDFFQSQKMLFFLQNIFKFPETFYIDQELQNKKVKNHQRVILSSYEYLIRSEDFLTSLLSPFYVPTLPVSPNPEYPASMGAGNNAPGGGLGGGA